jgi:dTDP-3-amino-3,4,6-trideoxy-alpha-D-glucose transaminase
MHRSMRPIPIARLDNVDPELLDELLEVVQRVARSGAFTLGPELEGFESEYASYCETAHAIGVSSGTEALILALRALGVGAGDEVIVPANSFIATAEAVSLVGATPRFVDVDPGTHLITAEHISGALSPRTRCVIAVHLYGRTVTLKPILTLAREHGLTVIEDACQAHGAVIDGRRVGSLGDAGCFSFYPTKNLGGWGDGGTIVTNDDTLADHLRMLRSHGERTRNHHEVIGTTARLDALQAAILRVKLRHLDGWNERRRLVAAKLSEALGDSPVKPPAPVLPEEDHVFHQFVVEARDRDGLREHLANGGVSTAIHYPTPIHRTPAYASAGLPEGSLHVSEALAQRICSLPIHPSMTDEEVQRTAAAVCEFPAGP